MNKKLWLLGFLAAALVSSAGCSARSPQGSADVPDLPESPVEEDASTGQAVPPTVDGEATTNQLSEYQGTFLIPGTEFQITVNPPFNIIHSVEADNLTLTVPDDNSIMGYLFYTKDTESLDAMVKNMDAANDSDPTITEFKKDVQENDGKKTYTFTYSAGESEGSPAGFYYNRYQETDDGFISAQVTCSKIIYADQIMELFDSISTATTDAKDAPTA